MRIGILTHNYPLNFEDRKDAGIFLYDFAQELSKKVEVFVLCPNFAGEKEKYTHVPVTWFNWRGGDKKLGSLNPFNPVSIIEFIDLLLKGSKATKEFVKQNKIDFLLSAWILPSGVFALEASRTFSVPYATWSLGSDINQYSKIPVLRQLITLAAKKAKLNFANSYLLCRKVSSLTGKKCDFLPAITNFEKPKIIKKSPNKVFQFLFVGRLEKVKGIDILIDACNNLQNEKFKFNLKIIGSGSLEGKIKNKIDSYRLGNQVSMMGRIGSKEMAIIMTESDCLVIPSRNESLPLVLIEAAKCSLPVVATDVGDCKKLITEYRTGFVAKREDSSDLSKQMKKALKQKNQFKSQRKLQLESLSNQFNQQVAVSSFLNYLK